MQTGHGIQAAADDAARVGGESAGLDDQREAAGVAGTVAGDGRSVPLARPAVTAQAGLAPPADELHGPGCTPQLGFAPRVGVAPHVGFAGKPGTAYAVSAHTAPAQTAPAVAPNVGYASFIARAAAAVIDFVILQVATMVIDSVFIGMLLQSLSTTTILVATIGPLVVGCGLAFVYSVWMESSAWQATPGKMMLGLKVVDLDGERLSLGQSTQRNLAKGLSMLTLGFGYLMPLWHARRQALHDSATGCLVVRSA